MNIIDLFPIPLAIIKNPNNDLHKKALISECNQLKQKMTMFGQPK